MWKGEDLLVFAWKSTYPFLCLEWSASWDIGKKWNMRVFILFALIVVTMVILRHIANPLTLQFNLPLQIGMILHPVNLTTICDQMPLAIHHQRNNMGNCLTFQCLKKTSGMKKEEGSKNHTTIPTVRENRDGGKINKNLPKGKYPLPYHVILISQVRRNEANTHIQITIKIPPRQAHSRAVSCQL